MEVGYDVGDLPHAILDAYYNAAVLYRDLVYLLEDGSTQRYAAEVKAIDAQLDEKRANMDRLARLIDETSSATPAACVRLRVSRLGGQTRAPRPVEQRLVGLTRVDEVVARSAKRLYESNVMTIKEVSAALDMPVDRTYLTLIKAGTEFRQPGRRTNWANGNQEQREMNETSDEHEEAGETSDEHEEAGDLPRDLPKKFTKRQNEAVALLVEGLSYTEIGSRLGISVITVRQHLSCAWQKAKVHGDQALKRALKSKETAEALGFTPAIVECSESNKSTIVEQRPEASPEAQERLVEQRSEMTKRAYTVHSTPTISRAASGKFLVRVTYEVDVADLGPVLDSIFSPDVVSVLDCDFSEPGEVSRSVG